MQEGTKEVRGWERRVTTGWEEHRHKYKKLGHTRSPTSGERKLTLFAVGDDDQNIYDYAGASVKYLRRFEEDYKAKTVYLTQNYRSTGHIIDAANAWIASARD